MDQDGRQDRRRLLVRGGHLQADDFYVEENNPMDSTHLLFTGDIKLFVRELLQPADEKQGGFSMKSLDISTREGLLSADSLELNDRPPLDQLSDSSGVGIFVKNIRLDGLDYYRLLTAKTFEVKQVRVEQPLVLLKREISLQNRKPETAGRINLYRMLRGRLRKIAARDVDISDARLKLINLLGDHSDTYLFDRIDFDIRNVLIDSTNRVFSNKFLYSDDLNFSIRDYRHTSSDSLYDYGAAWVSFRSADMNLEVDSGFLTPRLDEMAFAKKVGTQTDRLNLAFDRMVLSRCRVVEFLTDNRLWIDKLVIDSLSGGDYRDKSYPLPEGHFPPLPATALRRLDFLLRVDTLKIHNSNFTYREYVKPALKPGRMWFTNVELTGRNITNSPERIAHDSLMQFSATGKLMGKGRLDLYLRFRLGSGSDVFRAKGFINQMELTALNPFLEHTAFVKVKKGYNNKIEFAFTADDSLSRGLMDFEYQKLKIRLIDKKNLRDKGLGESIASFIANTFVVRKNNPKLIFFERTGDIYFQRNKEKSFFNYLAKSVLSGVQSTIRGGNEERKELRTKHKLERQLRREGKLDAYFHEK